MSEIKTLADQLRSKMARKDVAEKDIGRAAAPPEDDAEQGIDKAGKLEKKMPAVPDIIEALRAYDVTNHKTLIHARVDAQTAQMIHHLKIATGVEVTRLICFSIRLLFDQNPELKAVIREHLKNFEL